MSYGSKKKWKNLIPVSLSRTNIRAPFAGVCLVFVLVVVLSFSYYTSLPDGKYETLQRLGELSNAVVKLADTHGAGTSQNATGDRKHGNAAAAQHLFWTDPRLDILHKVPHKFDSRFRNPCWQESLSSPSPYTDNAYSYSHATRVVLHNLTQEWQDRFSNSSVDPPQRLRCLPYFLIIGQPKCGSTDLFWKMAKHPDIETPPIKELHWWSRNRQGRRFNYSKIIPLGDYVDMFDRAALRIEETYNSRDGFTAGTADQPITGEASVSLFWDNDDWPKYPENWDHSEPLYINPNYIQHIIPDVKLILMFRDPTERLYSDYLYFHMTNKSADDFHTAVTYAINVYRNCTARHTLRECIYSNHVANEVRVRLRIGMYSVFMRDWLRAFPRQQFYILRLEDYAIEQTEYVKHIFKFLGLRDLTPFEERKLLQRTKANIRKPADQLLGGMHDETRRLLKDFYRPYNEDLAFILQDDRYLWNNYGS